jgi:hypothetical protein
MRAPKDVDALKPSVVGSGGGMISIDLSMDGK